MSTIVQFVGGSSPKKAGKKPDQNRTGDKSRPEQAQKQNKRIDEPSSKRSRTEHSHSPASDKSDSSKMPDETTSTRTMDAREIHYRLDRMKKETAFLLGVLKGWDSETESVESEEDEPERTKLPQRNKNVETQTEAGATEDVEQDAYNAAGRGGGVGGTGMALLSEEGMIVEPPKIIEQTPAPIFVPTGEPNPPNNNNHCDTCKGRIKPLEEINSANVCEKHPGIEYCIGESDGSITRYCELKNIGEENYCNCKPLRLVLVTSNKPQCCCDTGCYMKRKAGCPPTCESCCDIAHKLVHENRIASEPPPSACLDPAACYCLRCLRGDAASVARQGLPAMMDNLTAANQAKRGIPAWKLTEDVPTGPHAERILSMSMQFLDSQPKRDQRCRCYECLNKPWTFRSYVTSDAEEAQFTRFGARSCDSWFHPTTEGPAPAFVAGAESTAGTAPTGSADPETLGFGAPTKRTLGSSAQAPKMQASATAADPSARCALTPSSSTTDAMPIRAVAKNTLPPGAPAKTAPALGAQVPEASKDDATPTGETAIDTGAPDARLEVPTANVMETTGTPAPDAAAGEQALKSTRPPDAPTSDVEDTRARDTPTPTGTGKGATTTATPGKQAPEASKDDVAPAGVAAADTVAPGAPLEVPKANVRGTKGTPAPGTVMGEQASKPTRPLGAPTLVSQTALLTLAMKTGEEADREVDEPATTGEAPPASPLSATVTLATRAIYDALVGQLLRALMEGKDIPTDTGTASDRLATSEAQSLASILSFEDWNRICRDPNPLALARTKVAVQAMSGAQPLAAPPPESGKVAVTILGLTPELLGVKRGHWDKPVAQPALVKALETLVANKAPGALPNLTVAREDWRRGWTITENKITKELTATGWLSAGRTTAELLAGDAALASATVVLPALTEGRVRAVFSKEDSKKVSDLCRKLSIPLPIVAAATQKAIKDAGCSADPVVQFRDLGWRASAHDTQPNLVVDCNALEWLKFKERSPNIMLNLSGTCLTVTTPTLRESVIRELAQTATLAHSTATADGGLTLLVGPLVRSYLTTLGEPPSKVQIVAEADRIRDCLIAASVASQVLSVGREDRLPQAILITAPDVQTAARMVKEFRDGRGAIRDVLGRAVERGHETACLYATAPASCILTADTATIIKTAVNNGASCPHRWVGRDLTKKLECASLIA